MKTCLLLLCLTTSGILAAETTDKFFAGQNKPAQGDLTGLWYRDLPKGQKAIKWYGAGHMSCTVYDDKTKLIVQHHEGTWENSGKTSVEVIHHATQSWKQLIGKTISHTIEFPTANTCKLVNEDGTFELWTRMP